MENELEEFVDVRRFPKWKDSKARIVDLTSEFKVVHMATAATMIGVSRQWITALCKHGRLTTAVIDGRKFVYVDKFYEDLVERGRLIAEEQKQQSA